jgi:transposase-like protein
MKRTRHSAEQIVVKLREADAMVASGRTIAQVVQTLGVSEQTYNRWRSQYGGMQAGEARRLKDLEVENARLDRLVVDQAIDISILREANDYLGKPRAPRGGGAP